MASAKKMSELKDAVNEMRKGLAAAEETARQAESSKAVLRQQLTDVSADLSETKLEASNLRQQVASLTGKLNAAIREIKEAAASGEDEDTDSEETIKTAERDVKLAVKQLRKVIHRCPKPSGSAPKNIKYGIPCFGRSVFAKDWSHNSLWTLGAAVSVLSNLHGQIQIEAEEHTVKFHNNVDDSGCMRHMFQWAEDTLGPMSDVDQKLYKATT